MHDITWAATACWTDIYSKVMFLQAEAASLAPSITKSFSSILYPHRCMCVNGTSISANLHPSLEPAQQSTGSSLHSVPGYIRRGWRKICASICDPDFLNKFSFPGKIPAVNLCWHINLGCLIHIMSFNNLTTVFRSSRSSLFTPNMEQQVLRGSSYLQGCKDINTCRAKFTAGINTHNQ